MSCYSDYLSCTENSFYCMQHYIRYSQLHKSKNFFIVSVRTWGYLHKGATKGLFARSEHATVLHKKRFLTSHSINSRSAAGTWKMLHVNVFLNIFKLQCSICRWEGRKLVRTQDCEDTQLIVKTSNAVTWWTKQGRFQWSTRWSIWLRQQIIHHWSNISATQVPLAKYLFIFFISIYIFFCETKWI